MPVASEIPHPFQACSVAGACRRLPVDSWTASVGASGSHPASARRRERRVLSRPRPDYGKTGRVLHATRRRPPWRPPQREPPSATDQSSWSVGVRAFPALAEDSREKRPFHREGWVAASADHRVAKAAPWETADPAARLPSLRRYRSIRHRRKALDSTRRPAAELRPNTLDARTRVYPSASSRWPERRRDHPSRQRWEG